MIKANAVVSKTKYMNKVWTESFTEYRGRKIRTLFRKDQGIIMEVYFPNSEEIDFAKRSKNETIQNLLRKTMIQIDKRIIKKLSPK